jgi:hypothetical protein
MHELQVLSGVISMWNIKSYKIFAVRTSVSLQIWNALHGCVRLKLSQGLRIHFRWHSCVICLIRWMACSCVNWMQLNWQQTSFGCSRIEGNGTARWMCGRQYSAKHGACYRHYHSTHSTVLPLTTQHTAPCYHWPLNMLHRVTTYHSTCCTVLPLTTQHSAPC